MPFAPFRPARTARTGLALGVGLAASLVLGVGAALPSFAAEGAPYTATGSLTAPSPTLAPGTLAFIGTCPDLPPDQGVDIYVFPLPADVAVEGAEVTVTGTDAAGPVRVTAGVFSANCVFSRYENSDTPEAGAVFPLEKDDGFLAVSMREGTSAALSLSVTAPVAGSTPDPAVEPTAPSGSDGSTGGATVRRDYSGGVNDPMYPEKGTGAVSLEWSGQWGMRLVQAEQAWQEVQATGAGVTVAVLDSGMDVTHPDFACDGKVVRLDAATYPRFADVTDGDGHGTHVAGTIGACTNNNTGVVGVAPDARILPIQALSPTEATADRLAAAIRAAVDSGAHVINMSLGFSAQGAPGTGSAIALLGGFADDIDPAIEYAVSKGVVVVAAAGNESFPVCGYPALAEDVVCVGSTDRRDVNSWYGNFPVAPYGTALSAPGGSGTVTQVYCDAAGEGVLSTYSRDAKYPCRATEGYSAIDGTSMASPHVAGVAALVYDRLGGVRSPEAAAQVVQAMIEGAKDLYTPGYDPMSGEGRVDALGAVLAVEPVTTALAAAPAPTESATAEQATSLELVAPATGQTTDTLPVSARVEDAQGPVSGASVAFRLSGDGGTREVTAVTGDDGVASTTVPLELAPGAYTLTARYDGEPGTRTAASDDQAVQVLREDSTTTLTAEGNGSKRQLTVTLADSDTASRGVGGASVVLFADGAEIGTVTTDGNGAATFTPTGGAKNASSYEARFAGDSTYTGSTARATA